MNPPRLELRDEKPIEQVAKVIRPARAQTAVLQLRHTRDSRPADKKLLVDAAGDVANWSAVESGADERGGGQIAKDHLTIDQPTNDTAGASELPHSHIQAFGSEEPRALGHEDRARSLPLSCVPNGNGF